MTETGERAFVPEPSNEEQEDEKQEVNVRLMLFFDGTLNNRTNVDERLAGTDIYERHQKAGSYNNAASNIALLERYVDQEAEVEGYDHVVSIYTEGAGTKDRKRDYMLGYALGVDKTGIDAKVEKGVEEAINRINGLILPREQFIGRLSVDLFGFSRGAASARYCVHQITSQGDLPIQDTLEAKDINLQQLNINFIGLFDTVSSHGVIYSNDVRTLKLDAVAQAKKVVQLAASEEYRAKFSLTDISSCEGSNGQQIFLPGAHSDIGGGYPNGEERQVVNIGPHSSIQRDKQWLINQGWYKEEEMEEVNLGPHPQGVEVALHVHREHISNAYSKIPLKIMAKFCREEGVTLIDEFPEKVSTEGESESLRSIDSTLMDYVNSGTPSEADDWQVTTPLLNEVRNRYLHMSARYDIGMKPRFRRGLRTRKTYRG